MEMETNLSLWAHGIWRVCENAGSATWIPHLLQTFQNHVQFPSHTYIFPTSI